MDNSSRSSTKSSNVTRRRSSSSCRSNHSRRSRSRSSSKSGRRSCRSKYHRLARRSNLSAIKESFGDDEHSESTYENNGNDFIRSLRRKNSTEDERLILVNEARLEFFSEIARSEGETKTPQAHKSIDKLLENYNARHFNPHKLISKLSTTEGCQLEGTWIALSKAQFSDCLGVNDNNECMYTLSRMSFGMFRPSNLVCSIQGIFNIIDVVDGSNGKEVRHVPPSLLGDVREGKYPVRSYNIVTAFTIEPHQPEFGSANLEVDEPIEGVMTTFGYLLPYPKQRDRFSIWFTGGKLEIITDRNKTKQLFENIGARSFSEKSKLFLAKFLMGASVSDQVDADGMISYQLTRPIAAYIDLLYLDEGLRIMRSSSGVVYVFSRTQDVDDVTTITSDETFRSLSTSGRGSSSDTLTDMLITSSSGTEYNEGTEATKSRLSRQKYLGSQCNTSNQPVTSTGSSMADIWNESSICRKAMLSAPKRPSRCISPERDKSKQQSSIKESSISHVKRSEQSATSCFKERDSSNVPKRPSRCISPERENRTLPIKWKESPQMPSRSVSPGRELSALPPNPPKRCNDQADLFQRPIVGMWLSMNNNNDAAEEQQEGHTEDHHSETISLVCHTRGGSLQRDTVPSLPMRR